MADYVSRVDKTPVSHHRVANLWREHGLKPHRQGTFKMSNPGFDGDWIIWFQGCGDRLDHRV